MTRSLANKDIDARVVDHLRDAHLVEVVAREAVFPRFGGRQDAIEQRAPAPLARIGFGAGEQVHRLGMFCFAGKQMN